MKRTLFLVAALGILLCTAEAQTPYKVRPDALPPLQENIGAKALQMAASVDEMVSWDRYPTYETYLAMMQQWADDYPSLCHIDTIGYSKQGRLILSIYIEGGGGYDNLKPEFFYTSTIHGDEVTGYVMLLHLIDTLLASYGNNGRITELLDRTCISINPIANPDGTYHNGNHTVQGSVRYNADGLDLNRCYPDPFGPNNFTVPQENQAMIDYVSAHHFLLSANLHGGSEVMNYPWDCFTSASRPHPQAEWWREVGQRFVDSARVVDNYCFRDVSQSGVIAGGDWYVIHGGRQDYMNYYHRCLEMTMEVSSIKTLQSERLPHYWQVLATSLINYIDEIHSLPEDVAIRNPQSTLPLIAVWPNPTSDVIHFDGLSDGTQVEILNAATGIETDAAIFHSSLDVSALPSGVYILRVGTMSAKIVKK